MDFISALLNSMPGAVTQGLIWGIMAIGVYITFRILDIADLTVDGSLCTGGAVCVVLTLNGCPTWLALLAALAAGMLAGLVTGIFHTFCGIPAILAGILTQLALYSINLRIMGWGTENGSRSNLPISVDKYDLMVSSRYVRELSLDNPLPKLIIFLAVIILVLYWLFGTETGCALRATGANENMAKAQGINTSFTKVLGLMISNGLVALSGGLLCPVPGLLRYQHGPGRHRHRTGRRHHRRGHSGTGLPQLRPQAGRACAVRRHHLLSRHPGRAAAEGLATDDAQAPHRRHRGHAVPGRPLLEGQVHPREDQPPAGKHRDRCCFRRKGG